MNFNRSTWFILCLASLACIPITFHFFPRAFPILSLNITMNRAQALERARDLAEQYQLMPKTFDQAAIFDLDEHAKTFIELDGGGKDALVETMEQDLYMPYIWVVRHFQEGNPRTSLIRFKPDGTPYGFEQRLSENDPGENLSPEYARVIAETQARDAWHIDFSVYTPIETAQETQPSGRIDHSFVYERTNLTIGSGGKYRLRLGVCGDQFSTLTHALYIPETFTRRYEELRSANETIAQAAYHWYYLFYFLGGCVLGILWLARARWLLIRTPLIWALVIAFLLALSKLNQLPIIWIMYDTALPAQDFLLSYLVSILNEFARTIIPLALGFIAAESLSRKAFGSHPQLWHVWSLPSAASYTIAGSTIGAYLLVSFDFALVSVFYAFTITYYNWWVPSSQFFDPNILATYFPWLEPCITALYAGFREECLFRAIPLAGAALIGERIGKRNFMIILAFIMQAIVFSAIHANYPGQPAYARLVELIIPSCIYGYIYLRYGLLTVIISHTVYDIIWMALPLFISHAPYAWINQVITIAIALIPLVIILDARMRNGAWSILQSAQRNSSWQPPALTSAVLPPPSTHESISHVIAPPCHYGLLLVGLIGVPLWFFTVQFHNDALPLYTQRHEALTYAQEYARKNGMQTDHWYPIITMQNADDDNDQKQRFVWQHTDPQTYQKLLYTYLTPPRWLIRFINFNTDLVERTEEYRVGIQDTNRIHGFYHVLPEPTPGANLDVEEARAHIHAIIAQETNIDPLTLIEVEATPQKQPARTDWNFILADPETYTLSQGQGRMIVQLAGDLFSRLSWYVHVPEAWERTDRSMLNKTKTIQIFCSLLFYLLTLLAACAIAHTRRFSFNIPIWRALFGFLLLLDMLLLIFSWPALIANISTSEPFYNQIFAILGARLIQLLIHAGIISILLLTVTTIKYRYTLKNNPHRNLYGLGLGTLIAGLLSWIELLKPSLKPHWANYDALNSLAPTTTIIVNALLELFIMGAAIGMLYALIDYITNSGNRNYFFGIICMLLFGLCVTARQPIYSISYWIFAGIALGIIITAVYYLLLRFDRALIPLVIIPMIVADHIQQAALNAFTDSIPMHLLAALYCIIAAYMWSYSFNIDAEPSKTSIHE